MLTGPRGQHVSRVKKHAWGFFMQKRGRVLKLICIFHPEFFQCSCNTITIIFLLPSAPPLPLVCFIHSSRHHFKKQELQNFAPYKQIVSISATFMDCVPYMLSLVALGVRTKVRGKGMGGGRRGNLRSERREGELHPA